MTRMNTNPAMIDRLALKSMRINLATAGERTLHLGGHSFWIVGSNSVNDVVTLSVNFLTGDGVTVGRGFFFEHQAFSELHFSWDAQADGYIDIMWGGDPRMANPERFRVGPTVTSSAVEVTNVAANPVPVEVQGTADVNIASIARRSLPAAAGHTVVELSNYLTAAGELLLHTVTAGKKLVIEKASVQSPSHLTGARLEIRTNPGVVWLSLTHRGGSGNVTGWEGLEVPEGYRVYIVEVGTAGNIGAALDGWEENA